MAELFERARSCALILDHFSQPTAIQHFTGWTPEAVDWLAGDSTSAWTMDSSRSGLRATGSTFYIEKMTSESEIQKADQF